MMGGCTCSGYSIRPPGVGNHDAMKKLIHSLLTMLLICLSYLGTMGATTAGEEGSLRDPFAYCATVGTIDAPGPRYIGPAMPEGIIRQLKDAFGLAADVSLAPLLKGWAWRCMEGKVYACMVGANLPCTTKADSSPEPAKPLREFCRTRFNAAAIPAVVTGRATIYAWRCSGGQPIIDRQMSQVDHAGFLSDIWYQISPE